MILGEMRDLETIATAHRKGTGHRYYLRSILAEPKTIDRIIDVPPETSRDQIQLASVLEAVSQLLVPRMERAWCPQWK